MNDDLLEERLALLEQRLAAAELTRTDDMAAAQAVVGYRLDPLRSVAPCDSPAL